MKSSTVKITYPHFVIPIVNGEPQFTVQIGDMFEVAKSTPDSVIHNFANNELPGGPFAKYTHKGEFISLQDRDNTQEEQLIRLYKHRLLLPRELYPIITANQTALLYSVCPGMPPVITLPSVVRPNFRKPHVRKDMLSRLGLLLQVCHAYNMVLVTGLWGCGDFGMKPEDLADLWKDALREFTKETISLFSYLVSQKLRRKSINIHGRTIA